MMDKTQLAALARLCRLSLDAEEETRLARELGAVLEAMDVLAASDLDDVAPLHHPLDAVAPLADDRAQSWGRFREVRRTAPSFVDGGFQVPLVLGEKK